MGSRDTGLAEQMQKAPEAYKGIAVPNFPNYFFAVGPNGLVLNVPYFVTVEQNISTIVRLIGAKDAADAKSIEVKLNVHETYNDWMRPRFSLFSWGDGSCNSYYRFDDGRAPFLFPGDFKTYKTMQDEIRLEDFSFNEQSHA